MKWMGTTLAIGQLGDGRCLGAETADEIFVACQGRGQDLDRHITLQFGFVALVDVAHPAAADPLEDLIMSQALEGEFIAGGGRAGSSQHGALRGRRGQGS